MKAMKIQFMTTLLAAFVTLGFVACGNDDDEINPTKEVPGGNEEQQPGVEEPDTPIVSASEIFPKGLNIEIYNVEYPGTLPELIPAEKKAIISALKVTGPLNGTDLRFLREMAGRDISGDVVDDAALNYLDISETSIVEGGQSYYKTGKTYYDTENDILGSYLFYRTKLKGIALPDKIKGLGKNVLAETSLKCVYINSDTIISSNYDWNKPLSYYLGNNMEEIILGNDVTSIGQYSFYNLNSLISITIPNTVRKIEKGAFTGCSDLIKVNITDVAAWCQLSCYTDMDPSLGKNPLYFAKNLYLNGVEVKNLVIPDGVTSIGNEVFIGCTGLTSVTIPNTVTRIGAGAFARCSNLTRITLGSSITSFGYKSFKDCISVKDVYALRTDPIEYEFGGSVFANTPIDSATLHIPTGTLNAYKEASPWNTFKEIIEDANSNTNRN